MSNVFKTILWVFTAMIVFQAASSGAELTNANKKEIEKKGIKISNLAGGLLAWVLEGGKVFDTHGETMRIHVYDQRWNYLPNGYEMVMFNFFEKYFQFS